MHFIGKVTNLVVENIHFMGTVFENQKYRIEYLPKEGLIDILVKDQPIEREDIIEMHREVMQLTSHKEHCNLFRAKDFLNLTPEARIEGARYEYSENLISQAFVAKNLAQKIIGNFVLRFNKPKVSTRLFTNEEEAKVWLAKQYILFQENIALGA